MADPMDTATRLLQPQFATLAGERDSDPIVRASDHADAQANGALSVAKRLGRNPRQVAEDILATTAPNPWQC
jgi:arginyl-tRNA synthetase